VTELLLCIIIVELFIALVLLKEIEENVEDLFYRKRHESLLRKLHAKLFRRREARRLRR